MDSKEPQIYYDEHGQGFMRFNQESSKASLILTPENTSPAPEAAPALEVSSEAAISLAQATATALELTNSAEADSQTPERKELSEQEQALADILLDARAAERAKVRVDTHDWYGVEEQKDLLRRIKYKNAAVRKAIASGLYKYRKGQPSLMALKKTDRNPKAREGLVFEMFKDVRYDTVFQEDLEAAINDLNTDFTFADLLEMHRHKRHRRYGRVGTSAHFSHEALEKAAAARDKDQERFVNSPEERREQALQRLEDAARDGVPYDPGTALEDPNIDAEDAELLSGLDEMEPESAILPELPPEPESTESTSEAPAEKVYWMTAAQEK
ncbi:MAG: hypothetical protein LBH36_02885 [Candidatus Nomurabacteria bacterium]|nr:hypothetical protein [Candidatus Nomurabacteria bacterium]